MAMLSNLYLQVKSWVKAQDGQDLIEYALIIVLLVVVAVVGLGLLGGEIGNLWTSIKTWLSGGSSLPAAPGQ